MRGEDGWTDRVGDTFDVSTGKAILVRGWTLMTGFGGGIVRFGATILREVAYGHGQDPGVSEEGREGVG